MKTHFQQLFWAVIHNCVAHPLLVSPVFTKQANQFHNWTATKAGYDHPLQSKTDRVSHGNREARLAALEQARFEIEREQMALLGTPFPAWVEHAVKLGNPGEPKSPTLTAIATERGLEVKDLDFVAPVGKE